MDTYTDLTATDPNEDLAYEAWGKAYKAQPKRLPKRQPKRQEPVHLFKWNKAA